MVGVMSATLRISLLALALVSVASARAEEASVPYWASIRAEEVNMRVGPGEDYRILWVFKRKQLPLKVLRMKEGWRFVQDPEGARGWVLARFLSRNRGAIVTGKQPAEMREAGNSDAKLLWRLSPGVTGKLGDCEAQWCELEVIRDTKIYKGWVSQARLWGAGEP